MRNFADPLWGYQLAYPDDWGEKKLGELQAFAANPEAFERTYSGPNAGYLMVRGEFNHTGESIDPLWNAHITKISMMVGAKNLGSAPLEIGGGSGYEAEIVMPKSRDQRLWTGILSYGLTILHLMAEHPLSQRDRFEPLATQIVSSLRFTSRNPDLITTETGIPLPPEFTTTEPASILTDINDPQDWLAFSGDATIGSLQAFYLRESSVYDWEIAEFIPYPNQTEIQFARLQLTKGKQTAVLGILPDIPETDSSTIVIKST